MAKYIFNCDADELVYACAFVAEKTAYRVKVKDKVYNLGIKYDRQKIIHELGLKGKADKLDYIIETYKTPIGPASYAIQACKNRLNHLTTISKEVRLFLTSEDRSNFRYKIATIEGPNGLGYKANRSDKPLYYREVRDYLLKRGATEVFGLEADDALGINQADDTVACHQDKDINRIVGRHYNWKTRERYVVEDPLGKIWIDDKKTLRGHGNAFFFAQMILGDRVDNIPSIIGPDADIGCFNMFQGCKTELDYFNVVRECFYNHYGIKKYNGAINEIADLLYIMDSTKITGRQYLDSLRK
jgi:hypothetical protein